jgi:hypothetical protein
MRCGGSSEVGVLTTTAHRAVEAQHQIATRKLVESDEEQRLLEDMIEGSKPPQVAQARPPSVRRLHYLLSTPFRYPPLRHGSRFGARTEPGVWYGAERLRTVFAEVAYYRLLFLEGTRADLGPVHTQLTTFSIGIHATYGIDLMRAPFAAYESVLASKTTYAATQPLGTAMREAGVEAVRYRSARDDGGGANVAVFNAAAFAASRPKHLETWVCTSTPERIEFVRRDYFRRAVYAFARPVFLVDGRLPSPGTGAPE